jgi:hypothetical protein
MIAAKIIVITTNQCILPRNNLANNKTGGDRLSAAMSEKSPDPKDGRKWTVSLTMVVIVSIITVTAFIGGGLPSTKSKATLEEDQTVGTETPGEQIVRVVGVNSSNATLVFTCTQATVNVSSYDSVSLFLLDGTDRQFAGPFSGIETFEVEDDQDGNGNDEIIRSITFVVDGKQITKSNPNFQQCVGRTEGQGQNQTSSPENTTVT